MRLEKALGHEVTHEAIVRVWKRLSQCLALGETFYATEESFAHL